MKKYGKDKNLLVNINNKLAKLWFGFRRLSFAKHIIFFYFFITLIGSLILLLPISRKVDVTYINSLFTSASAFSDTGLVTITTSETWTYFGQAVIAVLILIGGMGWFALKVYLFSIIFKRPISFKTREVLSAERGSTKIGSTTQLIKISITVMFIVIIVASIVLTCYFYFVPVVGSNNPIAKQDTNKMLHQVTQSGFTNGSSPYGNLENAIRFGIFHSISAINNAGFDIMGRNSISPYYHHYGMQIIFIVLFILGGMGYPVIYDFYLYITKKIKGERHLFSLFSKISSATYLIIALLSIIITFSIEVNAKDAFWHNDYYGSTGDKTMALIFNTLSTRNAGFSTIDIHSLSSSTLIVFSILMFIGSAPSSTAGGIRTTTIAIIFMSIWARIRGKDNVIAFNKRISSKIVSKAFIVFVTAFFLIVLASIITASSYHELDGRQHTFTDIVFEVTSAFGTTGLSTGITPNLSVGAKITLIIVMFIGQLGVSSSLLVWGGIKNKGKRYSHIKEDITIG
ncbi:TrkH family potassium uptake protein [Candidatus Mycoplasma mahonii]|uniref:TrkH family potassium uptake protein n=1 Tax=Candidatus Mycoplasma mahonii TaxID=3004105 RepID=UPI0026F2A0CD|nr:potassium transporter TrkG [Candidatus Mycoplasma mahonii]WKX02733.1 hypothetical protein O3I44_01495 [Candidatus Mycoplasma mahonii]